MSEPQSLRDALIVENLNFSWPQQPLFKELHFALPPGVNALVGDDGSGKTSLLRILAGELVPESARMTLNGESLSPSGSPRVFWVNPQTEAHDSMPASAYLAHLGERFPDVRDGVLPALVEGFSLQAHMDKPLYMLSTGSKRKVWLSAAWASGAPLTLIDHPFAALDAPSIRFLLELLRDASRQKERTWLVADYDVPEGVPWARTIRL